MKPDQLDKTPNESGQPKKKRMNVEKFFQQFNTLDMSNYGNWPLSVKITCWIFIFFLVCALGYFLVIRPQLDDIQTAQVQEKNLLNEFREKQSKLRNLQQYQHQLDEMRASFNQQLTQLPKESEIPGLVEDINMTGVNSGLKFKNIRLENEVKQEFFIEQPISIEATGDYHAFGTFVSGIAALPRIVTLHDFVIEAKESKEKTDIPQVDYSVKAKTYRYMGVDEQSNASALQANTPATTPAQGGTP